MSMKVNPHLSASTPLRGAAPSGALPVNRRRLRLGLAILLAAMTGFRYYYILHGHLNLDPDEAHYW